MGTKLKHFAVNDLATTDEDDAININVLANDLSAGGLTKTVSSLSGTTSTLGAAISINPDGTVKYDPTAALAIQALAQGETATDTFSYTLKEGTGSTAIFSTATVTVTLTGVNDAPTIAGVKASSSLDTNTVKPFTQVAIGDVDHNAQDSLTITLKDAKGNATDANGSLSGAGLLKAGVGSYVLSATSPTNLTSELDQLVFTPTAHELPGGEVVTTTVSLAANDSFTTTTATTSINVTQTPPTIIGYQLTLTSIPAATSTEATAISDNGEVAGYYTYSIGGGLFSRAGFTDVNGNINSVVFPGAGDTSVFAVNDSGAVGGSWTSSQSPAVHGFILHDGIYTDIFPEPGSQDVVSVVAINNNNLAVADIETATSGYAFTYDINTGTVTPIQHGSDAVFANDINDDGVVVGNLDIGTGNIGFIYQNGQVTSFQIAGAKVTNITAINNLGDFAGEYQDNSDVWHGFLDKAGSITTIDAIQVVNGLNDNDVVVGSNIARTAALVYTSNGTILDIKPEGAINAVLNAVNSGGYVAGSFGDSTANNGFFGTPIISS